MNWQSNFIFESSIDLNLERQPIGFLRGSSQTPNPQVVIAQLMLYLESNLEEAHAF